MKIFAFIFTASLYAAPVISGIAADSPTRSTVRIRWTTDVSATHKVEYGPTVSYGFTFVPPGSSTTHSVPIGGLAGATTYNFRVCSTNNGETCSTNQTFTTTALAPPAEAELPAEFSTSAPSSFTASATVSSCDGLQAQINSYAGNNGNNNYLITIDANLTCAGQFALPAKTGANPNGPGTIVLRGGGVVSPEGSTVSVTDPMPVLIANRVAARLLPFVPNDCFFPGDFSWDEDENTFALRYVSSVSPCTYTPITPVGSGTVLPATCSEGSWYYKTDVISHNSRAHWCMAANTWRQVTFVGDGEADQSYAAIRVADNASGYRVEGVRLQTLGWPSSYTAQLTQNTRTIGSVNRCLAATPTTATRITWDRLIFDGRGFPYRTVYGLCPLDGSNVAVVNSYFGLNRPVTNSSFEASSSGIVMYSGPGPVKIEGNYFSDNHGITVFVSDESTLNQQPTDVVVRANIFYENPCDNANDPCATAGRFWMRRNQIELKRGVRWLIEGNIFDGGWPSITRGSCLSLTPRPGSVSVQNNSIQIRDIMVRSNWFKNCMEPASIAGSHDGYDINTLMTSRVSVVNNLMTNGGITSTGQTTGWPLNLTSRGYIHLTQQGPEDVILRNNTYWEMWGSDRADMWLGLEARPGSGLVVDSNLYYPTVANSGLNGGGFSGGTAALDAYWTNGSSPYWWVVNNRWVQASGVSPGAYPSGIAWYATPNLLQLQPNYQPALSSPGAAIGAYVSGVNAASRAVGNLRALSVTSSAATIYWTAPDATTPCTVEYGTSATPSTGTRVTDTPSSRFRSRAISGLASSTLYYTRVYCGQMSSFSFQTQ